MNKKRILLFAVILTLFLVPTILFHDYLQNEFAHVSLKRINPVTNNTRLLVIAPHCDDETLGAAGMIHRVLKEKGQVQIVLITNGDGFTRAADHYAPAIPVEPNDYIHLGYIRQKESLTAMTQLGVPEKNVIFLGYPDGGTAFMWSRNWNTPFLSRRTDSSFSPYANSYRPAAAYTGENEAADLIQIISTFKPTVIVYPHPNDHHPDHWATHAFVKYALQQVDSPPRQQFLYLVHRGEWPAPLGYHPNYSLLPPRSLSDIGTTWQTFTLSEENIQQKDKAIHTYKSQMRVMAEFLLSFDRINELLGIYPDVKISRNKRVEVSESIVVDPIEDSFRSEMKPSADIETIALEKDAKNTSFVLKIKGNILSNCSYGLDITLFPKKESPQRLLLSLFQDKAHTNGISSVSTSLGDRFHILLSRPHTIYFTISNDFLDTMDSMLINGKTSIGKKEIDRTAWRLVSFH